MAQPSHKDKRYDRQLRLWGDHGQAGLESSHVCLVHATGVGTETIKNLVLPGIGAVTIIDNHQVAASDLSSNFFLTADSVGKSRGSRAAELLRELNEEVRIDHVEESLSVIITNNPTFFDQFSLVIATDVPDQNQLGQLANLLWASNTPLVVVTAYGMVGYLRLVTSCHEVVESHPDNYHEDLRLDRPFSSLQKFINSIDMDACENAEYANIPYLVIIFKYLEKWKESHDGKMPKSYKEKKEFKELIRTGIRSNKDGVPLEDDNFTEAINNVNSVLVQTLIPSEVQKILDDHNCMCLSVESSKFWLLARALKEFVANEGDGLLPLRGVIPDMTSSSSLYIQLQRLYQAQARTDMEALTGHLSQVLATLNKPTNLIPEVEVKRFCRNSAFLRVIQSHSLEAELSEPNKAELEVHLSNPDSEVIYYVLLRAANQFYSLYKAYPGVDDVAVDVSKMKSIVTSLLQEWHIPDCVVKDDHVIEFCRYGGAELHSVAAYMGGVTAQEVIKLLTHQYVPLCNTYIYNAALSTSLTVCL